ncbi:MAG: class I SAM-dependent methyltransferase, partial [Desulfobacterales bacterium]|nr:class I SAM-dependent methyltransferase [Desulfobacterales bacterium]
LFRCAACDLVQQIPQPMIEEMENIYSINYFDAWGEQTSYQLYWELKRSLYQKLLNSITDVHIAGGNALDVGCATGAGLSVLKDMGYSPYGIDVNPYAIETAKNRTPYASVHHCTLEDAPFTPNFFNLIVFSDIIEHVYNPFDNLNNTYHLLNKGGCVILLTPDIKSFSALLMRTYWIHYKKEHLFYFSKKSIERILKKTGFHIVQLRHISKPMNMAYVRTQLLNYPIPLMTTCFKFLHSVLLSKMDKKLFNIPMGELYVQAIKKI